MCQAIMDDKRTGYHYTSWENWQSIQKEGLQPYQMRQADLIRLARMYLSEDAVRQLYSIWVWLDRLMGVAHTGAILFQLATKNTHRVVLLRVTYKKEDVLRLGGQRVVACHEGFIEAWHYHSGDQAVLVTTPIPPEDIQLLRVYDVVELLK